MKWLNWSTIINIQEQSPTSIDFSYFFPPSEKEKKKIEFVGCKSREFTYFSGTISRHNHRLFICIFINLFFFVLSMEIRNLP